MKATSNRAPHSCGEPTSASRDFATVEQHGTAGLVLMAGLMSEGDRNGWPQGSVDLEYPRGFSGGYPVRWPWGETALHSLWQALMRMGAPCLGIRTNARLDDALPPRVVKPATSQYYPQHRQAHCNGCSAAGRLTRCATTSRPSPIRRPGTCTRLNALLGHASPVTTQGYVMEPHDPPTPRAQRRRGSRETFSNPF